MRANTFAIVHCSETVARTVLPWLSGLVDYDAFSRFKLSTDKWVEQIGWHNCLPFAARRKIVGWKKHTDKLSISR